MRVLNYSPVQTTNSGRSWGRADSALSQTQVSPAFWQPHLLVSGVLPCAGPVDALGSGRGGGVPLGEVG